MSKCFVILGMHRSATSLIAKGLHEAGVNMGDELMGPGPGNPQEHFEDMDFVRMNEAILGMAGGSWDNPPTEKDILEAGKELSGLIRGLIGRKQARALWGWKDPRTTLTIRCYLPFLANPHFIACFRDPADVAQSLLRRDGMPTFKGMDLARIYNKRLTNFLTEQKECRKYQS